VGKVRSKIHGEVGEGGHNKGCLSESERQCAGVSSGSVATMTSKIECITGRYKKGFLTVAATTPKVRDQCRRAIDSGGKKGSRGKSHQTNKKL